MFRIKIDGKLWTVRRIADPRVDGKSVDGYTDRKKREIVLAERLKGKRLLNRIAHESSHGVDWALDEEYADEIGETTAKIAYHPEFRGLL